MSHSGYIVCTVYENGILDRVAEVGVEEESDPEKFQSLSVAHQPIYRCDKCSRSFIKVDEKFLELRSTT
jgi:hypothetical protein